ncbi:MAG: thiamine phosphate synthase [Sulfuricurvum sp.]|nr:thiamine phosphate synthase [Sulfuricurvum sp.]
MQLYALCDTSTLNEKGVSLSFFVERAKKFGAEVLQYRNKHADIATIKSDLILLRKIWDSFLIINDHYELAQFCDGIHIGQEDLYAIDPDPVRAIKILKMAIGEDKIVGLSTHNKLEIEISNTLNINYIGLGAYRSTATKPDAKVLGKELDNIAAFSTHPVAAIGGIKLDDQFQHVTYHVIGSGLL